MRPGATEFARPGRGSNHCMALPRYIPVPGTNTSEPKLDPRLVMKLTRLPSLSPTLMEVVPGKREPLSSVEFSRTGLVPEDKRSTLVAAFNGGWQAVHGHYGMMVEGVELLPPVDWACGIVKMKDGTVQIHTWLRLKGQVEQMRWYRQTPPCLVDDGKEDHLLEESNRRWGTALGGGVVVRQIGRAHV